MSALDKISSRQPTGRVSWPLILLEGEEKAGKTYAAYKFTGSERVGRCFVADLGEGSADEYAPLGDYEILTPDPNNPLAPWSVTKLIEQVGAVKEFALEQLAAGEKPVVLIIDSMSDEWGVLVDAITAKASRSDANRRKLADDPAAEVKVPNHLWNDANAKHRRLMTLLLTFPGIVLVTARGKEVAEIRNGSPVEGSKVWKVEGQKNLAFDATCWIRMHRNAPATLEGARSLYVGVRPGKDAPRAMDERWEEGGLEWFVFDAYRLDPETAHVRDLRTVTDDGEGMQELPAGLRPMSVLEFSTEVVRPAWDDREALAAAYQELIARGLFDAPVTTTDGQETTLGVLVDGRGRQLAASAASPAPTEERPQETPQPTADAPAAAPEGDDPVQRVIELVDVARSALDMRAAWALSGELGVRGVEVDYPQHGTVRLGTLIQRIGASFPDADSERTADHAERAAGDAAAVGR